MAFIVTKEIAEKVKQYEEARDAVDRLSVELSHVFVDVDDEWEGCYMKRFFLVSAPKGEMQNDGEYCNQLQGYLEDDFWGTYYYPTEDGRYVAIAYET